MPVAVAAAAPVDTRRIEVHVPREVRIARIEGRRPIVAVGANIVEVGIVPAASGWKEDAVAVGLAGYSVSVDAILGCPGPRTLFS